MDNKGFHNCTGINNEMINHPYYFHQFQILGCNIYNRYTVLLLFGVKILRALNYLLLASVREQSLDEMDCSPDETRQCLFSILPVP